MFLILLIAGCSKHHMQEDSEPETYGKETVTIRIVSEDVQTKSAKDGDVMKNLRIWLVKQGENTAKYYSATNPNAPETEVVMNNIERGEYTMYIIANSTANAAYVQGSTIDNAFKNVTLPALVDKKPAFNDEGGMPLSLIKEIQVTAGVNNVSAELVRVCGKIRVTIHNKVTNKKLYLVHFNFTAKNPSNGYLFHHNHEVPAGTTYGEFSSLNATNGAETVSINAGSDHAVFEQYLYESGAITLGLDIRGALYPTGFTGTPTLSEKSSEKWQFVDNNTTNTTIQTGEDHWYIIANAANQRYFLCVNNTTLAAEKCENNDEEFLLKMNANESGYLKYLWNFSSKSGSTAVHNYGTNKDGRYMQFSTSGYGGSTTVSAGTSSSSSSTNVYTDTNNNRRRFYYDGYYNDYYLYYSEGLGIASGSSNYENRGWYLREMKKVLSSDGLQFNDSGVQNFSHLTHELKFIDDYGAPIVLDKICRNELLDIHLNVFHSESSGQLYFEVNAWRVPENGADKETTFD